MPPPGEGEGQNGKPWNQRGDGPLDENARADGQPEHTGEPPAGWRGHALRGRARRSGPRHPVAGQHAHGRDHGGRHDSIGLGEPRLHAEQDGRGEKDGGDECLRFANQRQRCPPCEQHHGHGSRQRWQPVEPDRGSRLGHPQRLPERHGATLEPVNAYRFVVARLIQKADVNEVATLEHLPRGLREARLVAIHRLQREKPRQVEDERQADEQKDRQKPIPRPRPNPPEPEKRDHGHA